MKKIAPLVSLCFLLVAGNTVAQSVISTDRPDQTESPYLVPEKYLQLEAGVYYEKLETGFANLVLPTSLWRYGLTNWLELRFIAEAIHEQKTMDKNAGIAPVTAGIKLHICEEKGLRPVIALIAHVGSANLGSKVFHTSKVAPSFRFTLQHSLSEETSLGYNLGAEWDGENTAPTGIYTLTVSRSLGEKLGGFAELYGFTPNEQKAQHLWDAGFTYLFNNNLQWDISGGTAITANAPNWFLSTGISYRFPL